MYLGIDIGTSGVKAVLVDEDGAAAAQASAPLSISRPHPLWSEQDPDDWWRATDVAVRALDAGLRSGVKAIGLAGQMHGATVLDRRDRPLRPAILWNDGRSMDACQELEAAVPELGEVTGNLAMPGFTAPKLVWLREHEPELFARIESVLLPKDYVRLVMTGDKASDMSDSAGTLWLDVAQRRWSDALLAACGLSARHMPALFEGSQITGLLRGEIAAQWGMGAVPVAAGGGDNAAGAAGVGVVRSGDALLSLGTSGVIFAASDSYRANPARAVHAFCHCLPNLWHQMSVHLSAASCIDWAAAFLKTDGPAAVFELAAQSGPASGPELFLPYLSGERTPHNDPRLRGGFLELSHDTTGPRLAEAVLEGVAFALADGLDALKEAGTPIDALSVIGGGARSAYWGRIIAAALDTPLHYLDGGEVGPALGAAKLAHLATSSAAASDICGRPRITATVQPDPDLVDRLADKKLAFRSAFRGVAQLRGTP